jgi:predicted DNA-binding transcriptional regulator AlpA
MTKQDIKLYKIWKGIQYRCLRPTDVSYKNYGGRGITVTPDWCSFEQFKLDVGYPPDGYVSLGRIDHNQGYNPGNCRWETLQESTAVKTTTTMLPMYDTVVTIPTAAKMFGLSRMTLYHRLKRGETFEQAVLPKPARTLIFNGEPLTIKAACSKYKITKSALNKRLQRGLSPDDAIRTTPAKVRSTS